MVLLATEVFLLPVLWSCEGLERYAIVAGFHQQDWSVADVPGSALELYMSTQSVDLVITNARSSRPP